MTTRLSIINTLSVALLGLSLSSTPVSARELLGPNTTADESASLSLDLGIEDDRIKPDQVQTVTIRAACMGTIVTLSLPDMARHQTELTDLEDLNAKSSATKSSDLAAIGQRLTLAGTYLTLLPVDNDQDPSLNPALLQDIDATIEFHTGPHDDDTPVAAQ